MSLVLRSAAAPRLRRARLSDVEAMAEMINGFAARGLMLPKTPAELYRLIREFVVVTGVEGTPLGCGGLRIYGPHLAEIVALAVREDHHGLGIGGRVVDRLVEDARALGIASVFAMTLEEGFFGRRGFHAVPRRLLPEKMAADCRTCARREGCREVAVFRPLAAEGSVGIPAAWDVPAAQDLPALGEMPAAPPTAVLESRRLRVLGD